MRINPNSIRNFYDFTIVLDNDNISCRTVDATNFLYEIIKIEDEKIIFELTNEIVLNEDKIILDGNIRFYFLSQLRKICEKLNKDLIVKNLKVKTIKSNNDDIYFYQIKINVGNPITIKQRLEIIKRYINNYQKVNRVDEKKIRKHIKEKYGNTLYNYACLLNQYENLPIWLKEKGDKLNVAPQVLIEFNRHFGTDKNKWKKLVSNAIQTSKNELKITRKNIENILNQPKSDLMLSEEVEVSILTDEELKEKSLELLEKIKERLPSVTLKNYESKNWKKFLSILDEFLYVIENIE